MSKLLLNNGHKSVNSFVEIFPNITHGKDVGVQKALRLRTNGSSYLTLIFYFFSL